MGRVDKVLFLIVVAAYTAVVTGAALVNGSPTNPDGWMHYRIVSDVFMRGLFAEHLLGGDTLSYNTRYVTVNTVLYSITVLNGLSPSQGFAVFAAVLMLFYAGYAAETGGSRPAAGMLLLATPLFLLAGLAVNKEAAALPQLAVLMSLGGGFTVAVILVTGILLSHHITFVVAALFVAAVFLENLVSLRPEPRSLALLLYTLGAGAVFYTVYPSPLPVTETVFLSIAMLLGLAAAMGVMVHGSGLKRPVYALMLVVGVVALFFSPYTGVYPRFSVSLLLGTAASLPVIILAAYRIGCRRGPRAERIILYMLVMLIIYFLISGFSPLNLFIALRVAGFVYLALFIVAMRGSAWPRPVYVGAVAAAVLGLVSSSMIMYWVDPGIGAPPVFHRYEVGVAADYSLLYGDRVVHGDSRLYWLLYGFVDGNAAAGGYEAPVSGHCYMVVPYMYRYGLVMYGGISWREFHGAPRGDIVASGGGGGVRVYCVP